MKKIKGRPHYYRNSKGYIYYLKHFTLPNGKGKQLYAKNPTEWEAKKKALIEAYYNSDLLVSKEYDKATFKDMTTPFLDESETFKVRTFIRRKRIWNNEIYPYFKDEIVSKLSSAMIDDFYRSKEKTKTPAGVIEIHKVLNSFMNWNVENDYCLKTNPISKGAIKRIRRLDRLEKLEANSRKTLKDIQTEETLSLEEVKMLLREVRDTKEEIIYHLQILHGLRIAEALGMSYENIDFDDNMIHVRQQVIGVSLSQIKGSKFEREFEDHVSVRSLKTDESMRRVPLQPATREVLLRDGRNRGLVYPSKANTTVNFRNWDRRRFKPVVNKLGLNISKTHTLRGFFASYHFDMGTNPVTIQKMMGHKDIQTTMKHYTKPIIETLDRNKFMMSELAV